MAYKHFAKNTKEFQMFQEFWSIFQKFGQIENTEEYWNDFVNNAGASFDQMCNIMRTAGNVNDSLFFWALKDSLWKL